MKKSVSEIYCFLREIYDDQSLSERTYRKWFKRFESSNFNLEDEELKTLLNEYSLQTQEKLVKKLGVTHQAISHRLKTLGMIGNAGNWVSSSTTTAD